MLGRSPIKKVLKKYKNKSIRDLSSDERTEVLKLMSQSSDKEAINLFIREDNGTVSARSMSIPNYLSYLQEKEGDKTVGELIKTLRNDKYY